MTLSQTARRRVLRALGFGVALGLATVLGCVAWIQLGARGHLYTAGDVPEAPVALVLGAQVYPDGTPSPVLAARLALAKRLYDEGKVRVLLVSGDNRQPEYDEPGAMRGWLVTHGVPEGKVIADYAGLDTYDSCARANKIFGVKRLVVVTQSYHIARAVTLCRSAGLDAAGVGDESVRQHRVSWYRAAVREYGAAVKAAFDVARGRDPVHLGRHETGVEDALRR